MAARGHDRPSKDDDRAFLQIVVSEYYRELRQRSASMIQTTCFSDRVSTGRPWPRRR